MREIPQVEAIRSLGEMKFRPCIDLHNGVVKQIVGSTLSENAEVAPTENFVAEKPAADFARFDRVLLCNLPSW
jgi:phosphoribosylformimino-5-aminoimidazole carboxamide ribonucleotide (ProFAR) isomerase